MTLAFLMTLAKKTLFDIFSKPRCFDLKLELLRPVLACLAFIEAIWRVSTRESAFLVYLDMTTLLSSVYGDLMRKFYELALSSLEHKLSLCVLLKLDLSQSTI